jgi:hypothetical protein
MQVRPSPDSRSDIAHTTDWGERAGHQYVDPQDFVPEVGEFTKPALAIFTVPLNGPFEWKAPESESHFDDNRIMILEST